MKTSTKVIIIILILTFALFLIRLISPTEIDDVSPGIFCPEIEKYNPEILWIIPLYNNEPISQNKTFCNNILSLNKTLGLHGIYHNPYREFLDYNISNEYLQLGIKEFESCFNQKPEMFKPPQLKISKENKILLKEENLKLKNIGNQLFHKVYHCNDTGKLPNWFIRVF